MENVPALYEEPLNWEKLLLLYEAALAEVRTRIEVINKEYKLNTGSSPIEHISTRMKAPKSILRKLAKNSYESTLENIVKYINDVAGIRIICSFTSDIFDIAAYIMKQDDINVLKIKDYITSPKPNGYMSYHMIVSVPVHLAEKIIYTKVEIQIRTSAMDFWASLEHKMYYKFDGKAPEHIKRELHECADIVAFLDRKMLALNDEIVQYKEHKKDVTPLVDEVEMVSEYLGVIIDDQGE